jgi:hypothetical protein
MPYVRQISFLETSPYYTIKYNELLKEARIWNSTSQYFLGCEAERRAKCLLNGNIKGYEQRKHSEELFFIKNKHF